MKVDDNTQVLARLAALKDMTVRELKAEWAKLTCYYKKSHVVV
jgi:hypothetical protein